MKWAVVKNLKPSDIALKPGESVALVTSYRLGDSLLSMILVHQLHQAGYEVGVFSGVLSALKEWFPGKKIFPFSLLAESAKNYRRLWYERPNRMVPLLKDPQRDRVIILKRSAWYRRPVSMAEVFLALCREAFGLSGLTPENGLNVPAALPREKDFQRVILHPTSSSRWKSWPLSRFLALASRLRNAGFEVEAVVAPEEGKTAERIRQSGLSCFVEADLSMVAGRLRQAGWFIGNDSGLGQLASNVGTPTLILYPLPRRAARWLPCWAPARAVLPELPGGMPEIFSHLFWKYAMKPETVFQAFKQFVQDVTPTANR